MPKEKFDYEEEAGEKGEHHAGTSETGRFWGNAGAGIMPLAQSTGRVLLTLRSEYVNEPHTWGIAGGAIDSGENPRRAAKRELQEELGYGGPVRMVAGYIFKAEDFQYHNFVGVVPEEFDANLNWESQDYEWFSLDELPSPLHFGVSAFLSNSEKLIRNAIEQTQQESILRQYVRLLLA